MKRIFAIIVFLSLTISIAKAQNYGLGNADPSLFTKYRIPDTDLHSLMVNTTFNLQSQKSTYNTDSYSNDGSNVQLNYTLVPQYYLMQRSDERNLSLRCDLGGSLYYSRNIQEGTGVNTINSKSTESQINADLMFNYQNYINKSNFYLNTDFNGAFNMDERRIDSLILNNNNNKFQSYTLTAGIGWGRMRNVTPVVEAIRFQERLKQMNALSKDLDEKAIEELSQKFSQVVYYSNVHDRSDKYFWQDIEKSLANNGVNLNGLNQYADSYLRDVLNEVRFIRYEGFQTSLNLQLDYYNSYQSGQPILENLFTTLNGSLYYSHQLNLNSQISFNFNISGGPNVIANREYRQMYLTDVDIAYNYELTDRLVATVDNSFSISFYNRDKQDKNLTDYLKLAMRYFVEDNMSLSISYILLSSSNKEPEYSSSSTNYNNTVAMGFTYYIDRGLIF